MKKIALIKRTIGNRLKKYGFKYYRSEPNTWIFSRKCHDVEQFVSVFESNFSKSIRLEIFTSVDVFRIMEIRDFYPKWEKKYGTIYFWDYADEDSFIHILNDFAQIIIDYGLDALDELSIPTRESRIDLTLEMQTKLFVNHDSLCNRFIEKYKVSIDNTKDGIHQILQLMKEKQDEEYEEMQGLLLEMAAYYGNSLINEFNGEWKWDEKLNICIIILNSNNRTNTCLPLHDIVYSWRDIEATDDYLLDCYDELSVER
ncbi:hypothetical protein [Clostridium sp. Marseille-P299]|uniref:hypothetical protein n=1 Tax=Clostridium sp. Marseille-P299 TaxID=1805477 RepID=UPI00082C5EA8|nr:hypothetical protein [Clostridium sp. Marseille-P299]